MARSGTGARQKDSPKKRVERPVYLGLTANQIVAFNLTRAREWKNWTQEEAAEALEPYLGKRWSKASVSQAERSVAGRFIRQFTADEILAFARAFDVPLAWFFMPPPPWSDQPGVPVKLDTPDGGEFGTALAELVDLVFGTPENTAVLQMRLAAWLQQNPPQITDAQRRVADLVQGRIDALAAHSLDQLAHWQTTLRAMANHIEDLEARARRDAAKALHQDHP
ncbi:MAG: helix-turn-helix domain-containing protein [Acidimicrobiales bacterium]